MKKIELNFDGYWLEEQRFSMPRYQGVYIVYAVVFNQSGTGFLLCRIVDIGSSKNIQKACLDKNNLEKWQKELSGKEVLLFCAACIRESSLLERTNKALENNIQYLNKLVMSDPNTSIMLSFSN